MNLKFDFGYHAMTSANLIAKNMHRNLIKIFRIILNHVLFYKIKESDTFGIRTMFLSGTTRLPADCCFSDITDILSLNVTCSRHDKLFI